MDFTLQTELSESKYNDLHFMDTESRCHIHRPKYARAQALYILIVEYVMSMVYKYK